MTALDFDALTLDVGGVFTVPSHARLTEALTAAGVPHDPSAFWDGHYLAMHAVDEARSPAETFGEYVPAFCHHIGLRGADFDRGVEALGRIFGPSALWCQPIAESVAALSRLHDAGLPMAVVSNADGTVADVLRRAGVCQVGDGPGTPVSIVVDSGELGIAKPDPGIFAPALAALGVAPDRAVHIGDSVHYDIAGAESAGLTGVHFDPRGLCRSQDHPHLRSLLELLDRMGRSTPFS